VVFAEVPVAVPLIIPVAVSIERPDGRLGDIAYVSGLVPPLKLTGVNGEIATFL
jgi:hypothetical protein